MIKINLLPQEMAGARGGGAAAGGSFDAGGSALVAVALLLVFGINITLGGWMFIRYAEAQESLESAKVEAKKVEDQLKATEVKFKDAKSSIERMERLISVAESLDGPERVLWSRKLNMIPILALEGVFVTELNVTRRITEVETPDSIASRNKWEKDKKGPPPEVDKNPVINQTLTMDGLAYVDGGTENQRLEQIIDFYRQLRDKKVKLPFDKEESGFLDGLQQVIDPSGVTATRSEGREVSKFRFTMRAKPVTVK